LTLALGLALSGAGQAQADFFPLHSLATHLHTSSNDSTLPAPAIDSFYSDNGDPDHNYGVNLSPVPAPAGLSLLGLGTLPWLGYSRRRRTDEPSGTPADPISRKGA
jgi:hypothetical protein